jgi:hypothetical protein
MAFALSDRVKETTTTTGTGSVTLAGAATGFQTFNSAIGVGNTMYYCIAGQGTSEWEVGMGTLSASTTLARTKIFASSNAGSAVTFSAGTKDVFVTFPASAGYAGASGQVFTASGTFTIPTGITRVKVTVIGAGGGGGGAQEGCCVPSYFGGGAGGGGTAVKWLTNLTPGNTLTVTRGAGGAGGAANGAAGGTGGTSSVSSGTETITSISATGSGGASPYSPSGGGVGSGGDLNVTGGAGLWGSTGTSGVSGTGGTTTMGGGAYGVNTGAGVAGQPYGNGGSGGAITGGTSPQAGGAGANGVIFFEW